MRVKIINNNNLIEQHHKQQTNLNPTMDEGGRRMSGQGNAYHYFLDPFV